MKDEMRIRIRRTESGWPNGEVFSVDKDGVEHELINVVSATIHLSGREAPTVQLEFIDVDLNFESGQVKWKSDKVARVEISSKGTAILTVSDPSLSD